MALEAQVAQVLHTTLCLKPLHQQVSDTLRLSSRFFYASSACIYPENKQLDTEVEGGGLKEKDAWPAQVCVLSTSIPKQPLSRPICFACGNPVSLCPR